MTQKNGKAARCPIVIGQAEQGIGDKGYRGIGDKEFKAYRGLLVLALEDGSEDCKCFDEVVPDDRVGKPCRQCIARCS